MSDDKYLSEEDVSPIIGIKASTLRVWRATKKGPPYYKIEGAVRYLESELMEWVNKRRIDPKPDEVTND